MDYRLSSGRDQKSGSKVSKLAAKPKRDHDRMNKMLTSTPKGSLEIPASSASSERRDLSVISSGAGGSTT